MKYLKQFGIIIALSFIGELLHHFIAFPIPASIYGIVLLFILLMSGVLKVDSIKETGNFLIEIMPAMFIPAAVGLIDVFDLVKNNLFSYLIVVVVSTVLVMVVSGWVSQLIIGRSKK